jgi:hypothetical protein
VVEEQAIVFEKHKDYLIRIWDEKAFKAETEPPVVRRKATA